MALSWVSEVAIAGYAHQNSMELSWKIRARLRIFAAAIVLGVVVGVCVLLPINEFAYYTEFHHAGRPAW